MCEGGGVRVRARPVYKFDIFFFTAAFAQASGKVTTGVVAQCVAHPCRRSLVLGLSGAGATLLLPSVLDIHVYLCVKLRV